MSVFAIAIILYMKFSVAEHEALREFAWVFLMFVVKDLVMLVFGLIMILLGLRPCAAEIYGKIATVAFFVVMVLIMAIGPEVGALREYFVLPDNVTMILVDVAAIASLIAFLSYLPDVFRQFKGKYCKKKLNEVK